MQVVEVEKQFKVRFNDELFSRFISAIACYSVINWITFLVAVTCLHFDILHPSSFLIGFSHGIFSPTVWLLGFLLTALHCFGFFFRFKLCSVHSGDLANLNYSHIAGLVISDLLESLFCACFILFSVDSIYLKHDKNVETCVRLLSLLVPITTIHSLYDFFSKHENHLTFASVRPPPIQSLFNLFTFGSNSILQSSLERSLRRLKIFIIIFLTLEFFILPFFFDFESGRVARVLQLVDLTLIWTCVMLVFVFEFTRLVALKIAEIFLTKPLMFSIPSPHQIFNLIDHQGFYLTLALNIKEPILLKWLAFWDLVHLSRNSENRRAEIFAISQPGGHPRNWDAVACSCITHLNELAFAIEKQNSKLSGSFKIQHNTNSNGPLDREMLLQPRHIQPWENKPNGLKLRRLAPLKESRNSESGSDTKTNSVPWWKNISLPVFGKNTTHSFENDLFKNSQLCIWAIESLSLLVLASYNEDKFGVVQKDLSKIFGLFLDLQLTLDAYGRLRGASVTAPFNNCAERNRNLLLQAVSIGMHRMLSKFSNHLSDIPLDEKHRILLKNFKSY